MALKYRNKLLVAAIEGTYGTDANPTGAANAMLTHGLEINAMEGSQVSRDLDKPGLGNDLQLHVGTHVVVTFDVEVAGAGAVDTVPAYGVLLRGCGLQQNVVAGTRVEYAPVSSGEESLTLYFNLDGNKHALTGARGTLGIALNPQGIPYFNFTFTGLWHEPEFAALPTPDFSAFTTPAAVTRENTPTFNLHGLAAKVSAWQFSQTNGVFYDNLIGEETVDINDRQPTGQITIEAPSIATKNWFADTNANQVGALNWVHGNTAGNIVEFSAPQVQCLRPTYGERNGKTTLQMGTSYIPTAAGDDEFMIITR